MATIIKCLDSSAELWGLFTLSLAPELLFYSYIPISIVAIGLGLVVVLRDNFSHRSLLLCILSFLFALFLLNEIVLWTAVPAGLIFISWSLSMLLRASIYLTLLLFVYVFIYQRYPSFGKLLTVVLLVLPIIIFLPTSLNVAAVDIVDCVGHNGPLWYYLYSLELLCVLILGYVSLRALLKRNENLSDNKKTAQYLLLGSFVLLLFFFLSEFVGEFTGIYEVNLFGPIGMLVFVTTLSYVIVRYHAFNTKLIAAQALVVSIIALVGSQLFFIKNATNFFLTSITLLFTITAGYYLVRSVKREVKQREEIQELARRLGKANDRLTKLDQLKSEFVSIASHQLRSPLAAMLGYASMLKDGSYGKLPAKAAEAATRIEESSRMMAQSVEDYLNVSRIEAGHMKYNLSDFSLRETAEHITDDIRPIALKKGVVMLFKSTLTRSGTVHADKGKVEQIIHNLINNALKYTPQGTITIVVRDDIGHKQVFLDILDTGIGMSEDTLDHLFAKFERGTNANTANIHGTGLGLYTALKLAEAMGGTITARSDGEGKGSQFTLSLPLAA